MNHSKSQEDIYKALDAVEKRSFIDQAQRDADEIERLRERVVRLENLLADVRHNGLIYWDPVTERGAVARSHMMLRIDAALEGKP